MADTIALELIIKEAGAAKTVAELQNALTKLKEKQKEFTEGSDDFKRIDDAIKQTTLSVKIQNAESAKTFGQMKRSLKELKAEQENVTKGTKDWDRLSKAINNAEGRIGDLDDGFRTLTGSGIERSRASLSLFKDGINNMDFGKIKIGLQGLKAALAATGIMLIVQGVAYLISNFEELSKGSGIVAKALQFVGSIVSGIIDRIYEFTDLLGLTNSKLDEMGQKFLENAEKAKEALTKQSAAYDRQIQEASAAGKKTVDLEIEKQKAIIETNNQILEQIKAFVQSGGVLDEAQNKLLTETIESNKDATSRIKSIRASENKEQRKDYAEQLKKLKDLRDGNELDEKQRILNQFEDEKKGVTATGKMRIEQLDEINKKYERLLKEHNQRVLAEQAEADKLILDRRLKNEELILKATNELLSAPGKELEIIVNPKLNEDLTKTVAAQQAQIDKENREADRIKQLQADLAFVNQSLGITKSFYDASTALADAYFSVKLGKVQKGSAEEEALLRRQFKLNKAFQIANATMDGFKAVTSILAQYPKFDGGFAMTAAIVGAGVTTGANIAKIASTKFQGDTGGGAIGAGGGISSSGLTPQSFSSALQPQTIINNTSNTTTAPPPQTGNTNFTLKAELVETENRDVTNRVDKIYSESAFK